MPDFSVILQTPEVRQLVQEGFLERAFHDALFPSLLFRQAADPKIFPGNVGDSMVFTGTGLIRPKPAPLTPGNDPAPSSYEKEQWEATVQQYADSIDTHMPTAVLAIVRLLIRDTQQMGLSCGQTINRLVRNRCFNAGLGGHTRSTQTKNLTGTSGTLTVQSINGFLTARRPDLTAGSPVRYQAVSSDNPLQIQLIYTGGGGGTLSANVVGVTPTTSGDVFGPGTLSLTYALGTYAVVVRDAVLSLDRTSLVRSGGGNTIDALTGGTDTFTLPVVRQANARLRRMNVPTMPDGTYHCHIDPTGEAQMYETTEFQRLLTSLPDHAIYRDFAIGRMLGTTFFRNNECPLSDTVERLSGAYDATLDTFAGELTNTSDDVIHRALFYGQGGVMEYYVELDQLLTEAGIQGKVKPVGTISNNGIQIQCDRCQLVIRAPQNRLQDMISTSWKFIGDWPVRTDVTTGDGARIKRELVAEFTE